MKKRLFSLAVAIALPILASAQQNQQLRDRDPDLAGAKKLAADLQQANFHHRSFYLLSRFRIADAGYTDAGFLPTGESNGGLSLSLEAPHTLYYVPHKKVIFGAQLVPGYSFFRRGDDKGQFNYLARGDAHFLFNHLYLNAYALRADRLRAHVADINRLATAREDEVGVAGELKYSSRTSALFSGRVRDTSYPTSRYQPRAGGTRIALQALDRREENGRVSLLHRTFPLTSLFVAGELSNYSFGNQPAYDSRRTYYGGGFAYAGGRNQLRVEAGPSRLDFRDASQKDYSGISAQVRATRTNGRWLYTAGADRDLGFSIFRDNAYFIATSGHLGADYTATRRVTLHARTSVERDEYDVPVLGRKRRDDVSFTSLGFTYGVRRISAGVDAGWYERDSTAFGEVASGIRYVVRLSFTP